MFYSQTGESIQQQSCNGTEVLLHNRAEYIDVCFYSDETNDNYPLTEEIIQIAYSQRLDQKVYTCVRFFDKR